MFEVSFNGVPHHQSCIFYRSEHPGITTMPQILTEHQLEDPWIYGMNSKTAPDGGFLSVTLSHDDKPEAGYVGAFMAYQANIPLELEGPQGNKLRFEFNELKEIAEKPAAPGENHLLDFGRENAQKLLGQQP